MIRTILLLSVAAATLRAQDSSFGSLRVRAAVLRLPVTGHISDDWTARTGGQVEVASNVGASEIALGAGRVGFNPTTGKPPFTQMHISLSLTRPLLRLGSATVDAGARLTDVRMSFDDPGMVAGLRHEEEQLLSAVGRGRVTLGGGFSAFLEAAYGVLMTSTKSPTVAVAAGVQRAGRMPDWLRDFLR